MVWPGSNQGNNVSGSKSISKSGSRKAVGATMVLMDERRFRYRYRSWNGGLLSVTRNRRFLNQTNVLVAYDEKGGVAQALHV